MQKRRIGKGILSVILAFALILPMFLGQMMRAYADDSSLAEGVGELTSGETDPGETDPDETDPKVKQTKVKQTKVKQTKPSALRLKKTMMGCSHLPSRLKTSHLAP